jgi:hypothetical protein
MHIVDPTSRLILSVLEMSEKELKYPALCLLDGDML